MSQLQDNLKEIKRQKDKYLLPENLKTGINCLGVTGALTPAKEEQTKTVNPSTSQQNITPDYNKVLSRVTVNAVTSSIDNNIIASNIRNGVDILGVTGNYQGTGGEVKLFDTVEHMQADEDPHINDMAVVYGTKQTDVTGDSEFSSCVFPNTVVLDTAFSGNIQGSFEAVGGGWFQSFLQITSSGFSFDGYGMSGDIRVQYESQDGITYARTDGGEELQEFGTTIKWEGNNEFDPVIGKFMKVSGVYFGGLYNYATVGTTRRYARDLSTATITVSGENITAFSVPNLLEQTYDPADLQEVVRNVSNVDTGRFFIDSNNQWKFFTVPVGRYLIDTSGNILGVISDSSSVADNVAISYDVNLITHTVSNPTTYNRQSFTVNTTTYYWYALTDMKSTLIHPDVTDGESNYPSVYMRTSTAAVTRNCDTKDITVYQDMYVLVTSQLNATSEDVFNKIFYGKNGVETGALEVVTNLTKEQVLRRINIWNDYNNATFTLDSTIQDLTSMFTGCRSFVSIPLLDTSNITNMRNMFYGCTSLTSIPLLNTSNVTNMNSMFVDCTNLSTIPLLDTSNVTDMNGMFSRCTSLTSIPSLNTSGATNMGAMFTGCTSLTSVPSLDTSNVTNITSMFRNCTNLSTIPLLNTSSATIMGDVFYGCTSLTSIPLLDTSSATYMARMFTGCTNLTTVPLLNTSSATNMDSMFTGCTSLDNTSLNNILAMCTNSSVSSTNKTLKYIGLTSAQATTCQSLSNYSAFTAAGWTTGY